MRGFYAVFLTMLLGPSGLAQLTLDQKLGDLQHLAALYAKQYAPYEWKRELVGFDLFDLVPWIERARAARDDLDFYDLMSEYVSRLDDAHDSYRLPSTFVARLNFTVDIYDGKVLIDSISRTRLPANEFPFQIGDELVSLDGKRPEEWIAALSRYAVAANPRSTRRTAAGMITVRRQSLIPRAIEVGPVATVVTQSGNGAPSTHIVPWTKTGLPLTRVGPVPYPASSQEPPPDYLAPLLALQNCKLPRQDAVLGVGARAPVFALPSGFSQRLPRTAASQFTSGTIDYDGLRIGFIRIPSYAPSDSFTALNEFLLEIMFFQANTDGLIVDQMRNPGGSLDYVNVLLRMLMPTRFRTAGFEVRATSAWVASIGSAIESARAQGAPEHFIALLERIGEQILEANRENRGRTGPIPLDDVSLDREPLADSNGRVMAYTRPLIVLMDEFSASAADLFPATIQDNARGLLVGMRTMGAGGSVVTLGVGSYTEGTTSLTQTLMTRARTVTAEGYPPSPYIENTGVHPDIVIDYMTRDNLMQNGAPFVQSVLAAAARHIRDNR